MVKKKFPFQLEKSNDKREKWCQTVAEKCNDQDLKTQ